MKVLIWFACLFLAAVCERIFRYPVEPYSVDTWSHIMAVIVSLFWYMGGYFLAHFLCKKLAKHRNKKYAEWQNSLPDKEEE